MAFCLNIVKIVQSSLCYNLLMSKKDTITDKERISKVVKSSVRQSRIALVASIVSVICAIIIVIAKIYSQDKSPIETTGLSALGIIVLPLSFFNLLLIAGMVDSMIINAKRVSEEFADEMRRKRIIYILMAVLPFAMLLIFQ